jgi:plastocyanin
MRRRAAPAAVAAALLALPAGAAADTRTVTIPGKYFDPARSTAVAGDVVTFQNHDLVTHNVRIGGGVFDSGPILRFTSWSQQIDAPGSYPFVCTLHAFMSGNLDIVAATLSSSPDEALAGEPLTLSGRTAAGSGHVGLERSVAGGAWVAVGQGAAPAADGTFAVKTRAVEGASYRVTTPAGPGQVVSPRVAARVDVHLAVAHRRRHTTVRVHTMPATSRLTATLELYSRWHFIWRSTRRVRLDAHGRAAFRLPASRRSYARVSLRRGARGPALAFSPVVKLWNGRRAQDPDTIAPPMPGDEAGPHHDSGHHHMGR